jgi:hypothetical protein
MGFTMNRACERCNSGWMSRLETTVIPFLKPLLWGKPIVIDESARLNLARWLLKTVMAWEFFYLRDHAPFYTNSQRREFSRSPHSVPDHGLIMSAAHFVGNAKRDDAWFLEGPVALTEAAAGNTGYGYTTTFAIGQIALQVFRFRWRENLTERVNFKVRGDWTRVGFEIWPLQFTNASWPPREALDDQGLITFSERFTRLLP